VEPLRKVLKEESDSEDDVPLGALILLRVVGFLMESLGHSLSPLILSLNLEQSHATAYHGSSFSPVHPLSL
jgi:hypothetical protein